jgi:hypothetical protein
MGVFKKANRWYIDYYLPDGKRKREVASIPGVDPFKVTPQEALKALSIRIRTDCRGEVWHSSD